MNQRKFLYLLLIKRWKKYFFINLLVLSCTFFYIETNAQKSLPRVKSFSVVTGYGNSVHTTVSRYNIIYLAGDFSQSFRKPYKLSFLSYYFEPQFNLVHAMEESLDIEFGVNGGIRNYIRINSDFYFYQMLGTGPHYISAYLPKQARGFIFSDNFSFGICKKVSKNFLFLNLQFRIRHISNADLRMPNRGVNSYNFLIGLAKIK